MNRLKDQLHWQLKETPCCGERINITATLHPTNAKPSHLPMLQQIDDPILDYGIEHERQGGTQNNPIDGDLSHSRVLMRQNLRGLASTYGYREPLPALMGNIDNTLGEGTGITEANCFMTNTHFRRVKIARMALEVHRHGMPALCRSQSGTRP